MSSRFPMIFVSHGAPSLIISNSPTNTFLRGLAKQIPRPRAILCISGHYETFDGSVHVTSGQSPQLIYDFGGFPDELYRMKYPAPGNPALAKRVVTLLKEAGIPAQEDSKLGWDHGTWVPMKLMYPEADIPIVAMSIQPRASVAYHVQVGKALAQLRDEGVLIFGSGHATHNLREIDWRALDESPNPSQGWPEQFQRWLDTTLCETADTNTVEQQIGDFLKVAPNARRAHPTPDHFLPLPVVVGAATASAASNSSSTAVAQEDTTTTSATSAVSTDSARKGIAKKIHRGYMGGTLSMAAYMFN